MLADDEAREDDDPRKLESSRLLGALTMLYELALDLAGLANELQIQGLEQEQEQGLEKDDGVVGGNMDEEEVQAMVERERERCERLLRGVGEEFEYQGSVALEQEL